MTHDEAVEVLKERSELLKNDPIYISNEGEYIKALDYAIAELERNGDATNMATQFDERIATLESIIAEAIYRDDYPHHEDYIPIIKDMQSHIRKLESELEKWKEDARIAVILKSEPKWNRDI